MAKLITLELIETAESRGSGEDKDPKRWVSQWFSPDGTLVLDYDGYKSETTMVENLVHYLRNLNHG